MSRKSNKNKVNITPDLITHERTTTPNEVVSTILGRRSIRETFTSESVSDEVLAEVIECGLHSPSSKDAQPWRIHIVKQGNIMRELAEAIQFAKNAEHYAPIDPTSGEPREWSSTVTVSAEVLYQAALGLFIENRGSFSGGRKTVGQASEKDQDSALMGYSFEMIGMGAMIHAMWIAARARGLEGVFMGDVLVAEDMIRKRLKMKGDLTGVLALGYATGYPLREKLIKEDRVVDHR